MKKYVRIFLIIATVILLGGCVHHIHDITKISIIACSGTVSPEYQWEEELTITPQEITLIRTGSAEDTKINTGSWIIPVDETEVNTLFAQIEEINFAQIKERWFTDERTGDGYKEYTINYGNGEILTIEYDQNKDYKNIDIISDPIREFLSHQDIPAK